MRAAVYRRFGGPDTVRVEELPRPTVGPGDILVRVHASTVSAATIVPVVATSPAD
jgi:NADPH:quinone reductase-like Zn-dependent oxidoreductase